MAQVISIVTRLDGAQQVNRGLTGINKNVDQLGRRSTVATKSVQGTTAGLGRLNIGVLAVAAGVTALVTGFVRTADTMRLVENRLRLVTRSQQDLVFVQRELFQVAQDTRVGFEETANLFARLARSSDQLGFSQRQLLQVTETINQAIIVSGASATEASAGLIQFSQGLASGTLRGDELRSVLEQMPRLARAIADGLGVTVGRLRELGAEGELTGRQVLTALLGQAPKIAAEFGQMSATVGQSFTVLGNEIAALVSDIDSSVGITSALSAAILGLADAIGFLRGSTDDAAVVTQFMTNRAKELEQQSRNLARLNPQYAESLQQVADASRQVAAGFELAAREQFAFQREAEEFQRQQAAQSRIGTPPVPQVRTSEIERAVRRNTRAVERAEQERQKLALDTLNFQIAIGERSLASRIQFLERELAAAEQGSRRELDLRRAIAETNLEIAERQADLIRRQTGITDEEATRQLEIERQKFEAMGEAGARAAERIKETQRDIADSAEATRDRQIEALTDTEFHGLDVAANMKFAFEDFLVTSALGAKKFTDTVKGLFKALASAIIRELARVVASKVFQVLFSSGSGVVPIPGSGGLGGIKAPGGFQVAQTGFSGMVSRPTVFGVAERGPEHVEVRPAGTPARASGVTVVFQGPVVLDDIGMTRLRRQLGAGGFRAV